jgi:Flp pilus assembly protein CpaB
MRMVSEPALAPPRALQRPRKLDIRAVFGIFLMLVATVGSLMFWSTSSNTREVLVATRNLPAGATLSAADLAVARVRVDDAIYQAVVAAPELDAVLGRQLADPVHAHELLARAQLSAHPWLAPNHVTLTIVVTPETASGGAIKPGDVVRVLLTTNDGQPDAKTSVVLPQASVYDVGYSPSTTVINTSPSNGTSGAGNTGQISWLTLSVTPEDAIRLAQAKWAGKIDVALLPGLEGQNNGGN